MAWAGAVHEAIAPVGTVQYADFAVTHRKVHPSDPDRNLRIYQAQLTAGGRSWSPGSSSTMAESSTITAAGRMLWRSLNVF